MIQRDRVRCISALSLIVAIGCGSGKPPEASAKSASEEAPQQLAQTPADAAAPAAAEAGKSTIMGSVKFSGSAPAQERVKMDADPQCALAHKDAVYKPDVAVNTNGTLKNVFVYVQQGLEGRTFAAPATPVQLNQEGCMYRPHVLGIQANQPFEIVNNDGTLHNVNCKPTKSKPFNIAQPVQGMKSTKTFSAPEVMVKCACNVHPWMTSYIGVTDHPFFSVTGDDGRFTLAGLPAGSYTIAAWHEKYGTQTQTVKVGDRETATASFEFKGQ